MTDQWGSDVVISMPAPLRPDQKPLVDMGSFAFTEHGLAHNITTSGLETFLSPTFRPPLSPEVGWVPTIVTATAGETNATITYSSQNSAFSLKTRVRSVSHGFEVIATESHARQYRAFYPHQRALSPFTVGFELKGYPELRQVMDFFRAYLRAFMDAPNPAISVLVPSYDFYQVGVPVGGIVDNDHTGSNVFSPAVVFESVYDPLDPTIFTTSGPGSSVATVDFAGTQGDDAAKFFYPASAASGDPNATGASLYDSRPPAPATQLNPTDLVGSESFHGRPSGTKPGIE